MVLRLFAPPGETRTSTFTHYRWLIFLIAEGQYNLVPKRPDPLGANAALQYSVLGSTVAAAAYTSFATRYRQREITHHSFSQSALLIRSLAKLGLWAGVLGATANWYYHARFTSVVVAQKNNVLKPWKLCDSTKSFTIDDGCLLGAGLGFAVSVPVLFLRRPAVPRWTRCLGLTNAGACIGILGAHGYLQYTGERQKAYVRLERRLKRRSLELWELFWDKSMMTQFNPFIQLYIRHNVLWHPQQFSDTAFERTEGYDASLGKSQESDLFVNAPDSTYAYEEQSYYLPPFDYADDLKHINVEATLARIEEHEAEIAALLKEAEFLLFVSAHRQYEYCYLENADDEERRRRLEELQLLQITYNKIRGAAEQLQSKLISWRMSLQHKAILDSSESTSIPIAAWLPKVKHDFTTHNPALSIHELEKTQAALTEEMKSFEAGIAYPGSSKEKKDRWRMDLEDNRSLLRVTDKMVWQFEKMQDAAVRSRGRPGLNKTANCNREQESAMRSEKTHVDGTTAAQPPTGSLEPRKP